MDEYTNFEITVDDVIELLEEETAVDPTALDPVYVEPTIVVPEIVDPALIELLDPSLLDPTLIDPSLFDPTYIDPSLYDPSYDPFNDDGSVELIPDGDEPDAFIPPTPGLEIADLPNFDPSVGTPSAGDPAAAMEVWHQQEAMDTCAVVSQEFVLEQLTGQEFDEGELAAEAEANGWYTPGGGTPMAHMDSLLEAHGVPTETHMEGTVQDLQDALNEGNKVIVSLDSSEIWEPGIDATMDDGSDTIPGQGADHAVEVTGVVETAEGTMVVLNDPGSPEGQGCMIPVEEFEAAWADSSSFFVEAGPTADDSIDAFELTGAAA